MPRFMTYEPANMLFAAATATATDPAFASLSVETQEALRFALIQANQVISERLENAPAIEAARRIWSGEGIEIDADPLVSLSEDGFWVSAWVWVHNEEST